MQERPVTLADLKEHNAPVRAHCNQCQKAAYIDTKGMPEHTVVIHIAKRLRCSRCGSTDVVSRPCYEHVVPKLPGELNKS